MRKEGRQMLIENGTTDSGSAINCRVGHQQKSAKMYQGGTK